MKTIVQYDQEQYPVIYLRYFKDKIMYIGETKNKYGGRPFRFMDHSPVDKIRIIKASKNLERRQYWEAVLICKLKPANQNTTNYFKLIKKQNKNTNLVEEELKKEITPESLDKLRRKNNIERSMYWSKQIELAEQHKKEAIIFFKHFYSGYLRDKALDKKQKELENIK